MYNRKFNKIEDSNETKKLEHIIMSQRNLLIDFCQSVECYRIATNQTELSAGVDMYLKSIVINKNTQ